MDTIQEIAELWSEVRLVMIDIGRKGDDIAYDKEKIELGTHQAVALEWLRLFISREVADYKKAKGLVSQGVWDMYKATRTKGTYEQRMLKEAKDQLISMWKTRPSILHRTKTPDARTKKDDSGKGYVGKRAKS